MIKKVCYGVSICVIIVAWAGVCNAAVVISGQQDTLGLPFPFTVGPLGYNSLSTTLFIGASQAITDDQYKSQAISAVSRDQAAVHGITPELVHFNNNGLQANPLYGQQISFIALSGSDPFVVTAVDNTKVSFIRNSLNNNTRAVYQSPPLNNTVSDTSGIVALAALEGHAIQINQTLDVEANNAFFAALKPPVGAFGDPGSGIAIGSLMAVNTSEDEKFPRIEYHLKQTHFILMQKNSITIAIGNPLASLDAVIMKGAARHGSVYIGLIVTGGANPTDGAIAVSLNGGSVTPASAIQANSIIGAVGANAQVSIHFVDTLYTSTQLDYLVVVGGVGSPATTKRSVYALPITYSGYLAKKTAQPTTIFLPPPLQLFKTRFFSDLDAAVNPGDLYGPTDFQAQVGGNGTLPGDILALFTEKDAVFVAVGTDSATEQAGLFYSQMIFDNLGRAHGWTDWQRAYGITTGIAAMAFDNKVAEFWYFPGSDSQALTWLYKTQWMYGQNYLSPFYKDLESTFSVQDGGIQGLVDINRSHSSLSQVVGTRISPLIATGFNQVVLAESGADVGTLFTPDVVLDTSQTFNNGDLTGLTTPVQKIVMSGGALATIGPVITADIISSGGNSWLVVGGSGGVAVLANPDGTGWPTGTLQKGFVNLPATLEWKLVGSFGQVRKVIADDGLLYIVSSYGLYRMQASAAQFASVTPTIATLATLQTLAPYGQVYGSFSDAVISGKFAVLATSVGLFRVGNGQDVSVAPDEDSVKWTQVDLPESSGSVNRLFLIPPSSVTNSFADDPRGAGLYVLNATVSNSIGRVYRFAIEGSIDTNGITDTTMQIANDTFVNNRPSLYLNNGTYANYVFTDGAFLLTSRSAYFPTSSLPYIQIINPVLRTGIVMAAGESRAFMIDGSFRMGPFARRSATGSVMAAGSVMLVGE